MSAQAIMTLVLFLAVIILLIWQPVSPIVIGALNFNYQNSEKI